MAMLATVVLFLGMATSLPMSAQVVTQDMAAHARRAQDAERQNDFPTAVHEYQLLAGALPKSAEVQSNLGVALYFDDQLRPALAAFHKAIALNSNLMAPHLFSGLAWYRLSSPDAAVPELERAVRINVSDPIAHTWLGYAYSAQSRDEAALKQFQEASKLDPKNIDVWYALGNTWLQIGKDATLKLLALSPNGARVWELAGEQCQMRGDRKTALSDFQEAAKRRPDIAELNQRIVSLGGSVVPAHNVQDAKAHGTEDALYEKAHNAERESDAAFQRVEQLDPNSYRAHQIMAAAFVSEKQDTRAIAEYREVLKLKPDLAGIHEALGEALVRSGKVAEGLQEFEAEIKTQPFSASANMNAGRALLMLGRDDEAGKMLNAAAGMDRPPLETYLLLGKLDVRRRDYRGAIAKLTHYTSIETGNSTAYFLLAMAYRGLGEREQMSRAIAQYRKTSEDAKERSIAQRELQAAQSGGEDGKPPLHQDSMQ